MIKEIDQNLLSVFYEWCDAHGFPRVPSDCLPKRAYMFFIGEKPIIAGFLYKDETSLFSMIEWVVANPETTNEERAEGFKSLIDHVRLVARSIGALMIFTTAQNENLVKRYSENGFQITDKNMTHLMREV